MNPDEVSAYLIEPARWDEARVPAPIQAYAREHSFDLGHHETREYFFAQGGVFQAWWTDVEAEALAKWAASRSDAELAKMFLVNGFLTALGRAGSAEGKAPSVFERVHKAVVEEAKRRGMKKQGRLS